MEEGRIVKSTGSWYEVQTPAGQRYQCRLRGKFKIKGPRLSNPLAVGDFVEIEAENSGDDETYVITKIQPRQNYIIRKSTRKAHAGHILAANVDQAIVLATMVLPRTSQGFIDRFLVSAESFRIPAVVVFNKQDLLEPEGLEVQQELIDMYEGIGYSTLKVSAQEGQGVQAFKELLQGKFSLLAGHSGVGKSTLINALDASIQQRTNEVSTYANKGVHTTTFAEVFDLGQQTFIIDSPGIKEMGLMDINQQELAHFFPEMRQLLGQCRFHDCTHIHEPGCAVLAAIEAGQIDPHRYNSYLSMLEDDDSHR